MQRVTATHREESKDTGNHNESQRVTHFYTGMKSYTEARVLQTFEKRDTLSYRVKGQTGGERLGNSLASGQGFLFLGCSFDVGVFNP